MVTASWTSSLTEIAVTWGPVFCTKSRTRRRISAALVRLLSDLFQHAQQFGVVARELSAGGGRFPGRNSSRRAAVDSIRGPALLPSHP